LSKRVVNCENWRWHHEMDHSLCGIHAVSGVVDLLERKVGL
ncbi:hypothetical protein LCGC14_3028260, partial [marine sediment metagenome]